MTLRRMDNVHIVVDDLEAVKAFFIELGLTLEGETIVEGPLIESLIGLKDGRATLRRMSASQRNEERRRGVSRPRIRTQSVGTRLKVWRRNHRGTHIQY